jgi:uncharacterized protein (TIGR02466 family)
MPLEYFFPTPVYHEILNNNLFKDVQEEIRIALQSIDKDTLSNPWDDTVKTTFTFNQNRNFIENTPVFKETVISETKKYISEHFYNTRKISKFTEIYITDSWVNFTDTGDFQNYHVHPLSDISGVYYYQSSLDDGNIKFKAPSSALNHHPLTYGSRAEHKPLIGKLLLFPSFLEHAVGINTTDSTRISISFNIKLNW